MEQETLDLPQIEPPVSMDVDEDVRTFAHKAMEEIMSKVSENREEAKAFQDVDMKVDDVLDQENIHSVDIRARRLENPKVTLWLSDCPTWANGAWQSEIRPNGLNAYNGRVTVSFDVRPI